MGKHLSSSDYEEIARLYDGNYATMPRLGEMYGISRQGVWKALRRLGIDTRKRRLSVECYWCGVVFHRTKGRLRRNIRNFCSDGCYVSWLGEMGADYIPNRHGQRLARAIVGGYFKLIEGMVVHHEDKNTLNNRLDNLRVFSSQGDHIRYHRGVLGIEPVWSGESPGVLLGLDEEILYGSAKV